MNLYREVYPSMLQRSLRGKEASQAISKGVDSRPEYGREEVADDVYGASLLNRDDLLDKNGEGAEAEEESDEDEDAEEEELEVDSGELTTPTRSRENRTKTGMEGITSSLLDAVEEACDDDDEEEAEEEVEE
ncbi:Protein SDA1, partial [Perkinsus olseni]